MRVRHVRHGRHRAGRQGRARRADGRQLHRPAEAPLALRTGYGRTVAADREEAQQDGEGSAEYSDALACIYLVHRITSLLRRSTSEIAGKAGIHVSDLNVLLLNRRADGQAMTGELQRALGCTSAGITRRVDRLEEAGHEMVEQTRSMGVSRKIYALMHQLDEAEWAGMLRLLDQSLSTP